MPISNALTATLASSLTSALKSAVLILKLVIPLYILADVLLYYDLLHHISFLFAPVTGLLDLPTEAAMALAGGVLINPYAAIAFAAPLGLDPRQWTILAVFLGVCHAMPIECAVMARIGITYLYGVLLRLVMAFVAVWPVLYLPRTWFATAGQQAATPALTHHDTVTAMLWGSTTDAVILSVKIILLISLVIVSMDQLRRIPLIQRYTERVNTASSILVGQMLGITYGAGILIREFTEGRLSREDVFFIGTLLMICHSIIEDVLLFVLFGANYLVVVAVRVALAIVVSYGLRQAVRSGLPLTWLVRA